MILNETAATKVFHGEQIGVVFGAVGSFVVSRWISSLLYSVEASDPWTFLIMVGLLAAVAGLAGLIPALRASRTKVASVFRASII